MHIVKKTLLLLSLALLGGCAAIFPGMGLQTVSTALSLGSIGQTLIRMSNAEGSSLPVGPMPAQYVNNPTRMLQEAWEQNYQLAKTVRWESEEIPWKEVVAATGRKSGKSSALFALVERRALRDGSRTEQVTVYKTISGKLVESPAEAQGEAFYPQTREQRVTVPLYLYTAWFFTRSRQPSGILAQEGPWDGPCRTAYGYGALVLATGKNTPARKAEIQAGDIITAVNGRPAEYENLFGLLQGGHNTVTVCRGGAVLTLELALPQAAKRP